LTFGESGRHEAARIYRVFRRCGGRRFADCGIVEQEMNPVGGLLLGNFIAEPLGAQAPAHARAASGDDRDPSKSFM
jgi:hypothetical protein